METKYSNIFIDSWNNVIESFSSKQIKSADITQPKDGAFNCDIFVYMGIIGDIKGLVYMSMDAETGKVLASEMLGGIEITDVDEMVISAVGEMCNMIMGNACSSISLMNTVVDITPPTVVVGQDMPQLEMKPSYNISFVLEDMDKINFNVAV